MGKVIERIHCLGIASFLLGEAVVLYIPHMFETGNPKQKGIEDRLLENITEQVGRVPISALEEQITSSLNIGE